MNMYTITPKLEVLQVIEHVLIKQSVLFTQEVKSNLTIIIIQNYFYDENGYHEHKWISCGCPCMCLFLHYVDPNFILPILIIHHITFCNTLIFLLYEGNSKSKVPYFLFK
jgi:hypothetical protein